MKSITYISITAILLFAIVFRGISQTLSDVYRGHTSNDFYFVNTTFSQLSYITNDGQTIELKNAKAFWNNQYIADSAPGKIFSLYNDGVAVSDDYGENFNMLSQSWMNADTGILSIKGGEFGGLFYIGARCYSSQSFLNFKTDDSFYNIDPVDYEPEEIGFTPGEFYSGSLSSSNSYLTHTTNGGISYDTMNIADTIINDYYHFYKLSRGSVPGELFMITMMQAVNGDYRLYHSIDYGANWVEKNIPTGLNEAYFTAGRGECRFYIVDVSWYGEPDYTLNIFVSNDCGESYTKYTHKLPTFVGLEEKQKTSSNLIIMPNPAKEHVTISYNLVKTSYISCSVFNSQGICVFHCAPSMESVKFEKTIRVDNLPQGLYSLQIQSAGSSIATGKFIISR